MLSRDSTTVCLSVYVGLYVCMHACMYQSHGWVTLFLSFCGEKQIM